MLNKEYAEYYDNLIRLSERFVGKYCILKGSLDKARKREIDVRFLDDYRFFAFTRCTKSLAAYRRMLEGGYYEDAMVLGRTMMECYMSQRYFDDQYDIDTQTDMVAIPTALIEGELTFNRNLLRNTESGEEFAYNRRNPSDMPLGKDKTYSTILYSYLCTFAHCNFSLVHSFLDNNGHFILNSDISCEIAHLTGLFIHSKIYEHVVLLENIKFDSAEEQKEYADMLVDLTMFLYSRIDKIRQSGGAEHSPKSILAKMLAAMKNSFKEQLGRVDKSFLNELERSNSETSLERKTKPLLLTSDKPSSFFEELKLKPGVKAQYPELLRLADTDKWEHTMKSLDKAASYRDKVSDPYAFMLAVLTADMPKPEPFLDKATNNYFVKRKVARMRESESTCPEEDLAYMKAVLQ